MACFFGELTGGEVVVDALVAPGDNAGRGVGVAGGEVFAAGTALFVLLVYGGKTEYRMGNA